jgi:hypothetical protein
MQPFMLPMGTCGINQERSLRFVRYMFAYRPISRTTKKRPVYGLFLVVWKITRESSTLAPSGRFDARKAVMPFKLEVQTIPYRRYKNLLPAPSETNGVKTLFFVLTDRVLSSSIASYPALSAGYSFSIRYKKHLFLELTSFLLS